MWTITDRFPDWGETGEFPPIGFFYEGGDQINQKHLDALWNGIKKFEDETRDALDDIDGDGDGVVDEADALTADGEFLGDVTNSSGTTIWDDSENVVRLLEQHASDHSFGSTDEIEAGDLAARNGAEGEALVVQSDNSLDYRNIGTDEELIFWYSVML